MRWLRTISDVRDKTMTRAEMDQLTVWSLWQKRLAPYHLVSSGDHVWTVEQHVGGRRLGWETEVLGTPLTMEYSSKLVAAIHVSTKFFVTQSEFLKHEYTRSKKDFGYLLACELKPLRKIDLPLPGGLRLAQNGWTDLSQFKDKDLGKWGLLAAP